MPSYCMRFALPIPLMGFVWHPDSSILPIFLEMCKIALFLDAIQVLAKAAINGNHILKETSNETVKSEVVGASALCDYAQVSP